jgi:hypothetical protein
MFWGNGLQLGVHVALGVRERKRLTEFVKFEEKKSLFNALF